MKKIIKIIIIVMSISILLATGCTSAATTDGGGKSAEEDKKEENIEEEKEETEQGKYSTYIYEYLGKISLDMDKVFSAIGNAQEKGAEKKAVDKINKSLDDMIKTLKDFTYKGIPKEYEERDKEVKVALKNMSKIFEDFKNSINEAAKSQNAETFNAAIKQLEMKGLDDVSVELDKIVTIIYDTVEENAN